MNHDQLFELSIGELIVALPGAGRILKDHDLDWFKNHSKDLEELIGEGNADKEAILGALGKCKEEYPDDINWLKESSVSLMADHIVERYHKHEREEIKRIWNNINSLIKELMTKDSDIVERVKDLKDAFKFFRQEFLIHMDQEEESLFTMLKQMDVYTNSSDEVKPISLGTISKPLRFWEEEHQFICRRIAKLDEVIDSELKNDDDMLLKDICKSIESLCCSIRQHVNFEDVILEPAAFRLEQTISL